MRIENVTPRSTSILSPLGARKPFLRSTTLRPESEGGGPSSNCDLLPVRSWLRIGGSIVSELLTFDIRLTNLRRAMSRLVANARPHEQDRLLPRHSRKR